MPWLRQCFQTSLFLPVQTSSRQNQLINRRGIVEGEKRKCDLYIWHWQKCKLGLPPVGWGWPRGILTLCCFNSTFRSDIIVHLATYSYSQGWEEEEACWGDFLFGCQGTNYLLPLLCQWLFLLNMVNHLSKQKMFRWLLATQVLHTTLLIYNTEQLEDGKSTNPNL